MRGTSQCPLRWVKRLSLTVDLLTLPVLGYPLHWYRILPTPLDLSMPETNAVPVRVAQEMKHHLGEHPDLAAFDDHWHFTMLRQGMLHP